MQMLRKVRPVSSALLVLSWRPLLRQFYNNDALKSMETELTPICRVNCRTHEHRHFERILRKRACLEGLQVYKNCRVVCQSGCLVVSQKGTLITEPGTTSSHGSVIAFSKHRCCVSRCCALWKGQRYIKYEGMIPCSVLREMVLHS